MLSLTTDWLVRRVFKFLLTTFLGRYIEDENEEERGQQEGSGVDAKLQNGSADGVVVLDRLRLKCEAVNEAIAGGASPSDRGGLPFTFLKGRIGSLQIGIPWSQLLVEPCQLRLDDVEVDLRMSLAMSRAESRGDDASLSESMMKAVEEGIRKSAPPDEGEQASALPSSLAGDSIQYVYAYLEKLLLTTEFSLTNLKLAIDIDPAASQRGGDAADTRTSIVIRVARIDVWSDQSRFEGTGDDGDVDLVGDARFIKYISGRRLAFGGLTVDIEEVNHSLRRPSTEDNVGHGAAVTAAATGTVGAGTFDARDHAGERRRHGEDNAYRRRSLTLLTRSGNGNAGADAGDSSERCGCAGTVVCDYEGGILNAKCNVSDVLVVVSPHRISALTGLLCDALDERCCESECDDGDDDGGTVAGECSCDEISDSMYQSTMQQSTSMYQSTMQQSTSVYKSTMQPSTSMYKSTMQQSMYASVARSSNLRPRSQCESTSEFFDASVKLGGAASSSLGECQRGEVDDEQRDAACDAMKDGGDGIARIGVCVNLVVGRAAVRMFVGDEGGTGRADGHFCPYLQVEAHESSLNVAAVCGQCDQDEQRFVVGTQGLSVLYVDGTNGGTGIDANAAELPAPPWARHQDGHRVAHGPREQRLGENAVVTFLRPSHEERREMQVRVTTATNPCDESQRTRLDCRLWPLYVAVSASTIAGIGQLVAHMRKPVKRMGGILMSLRSESDVPPRSTLDVTVEFAGARLIASSSGQVGSGELEFGNGGALLADIGMSGVVPLGVDKDKFPTGKTSIEYSASNRYGEVHDCRLSLGIDSLVAHVLDIGPNERVSSMEILRVAAMRSTPQAPQPPAARSRVSFLCEDRGDEMTLPTALIWEPRRSPKSRLPRSDASAAVRGSACGSHGDMAEFHERFLESSDLSVEVPIEHAKLSVCENVVLTLKNLAGEIGRGLRREEDASEDATSEDDERGPEDDADHTSSSISVDINVLQVVILDENACRSCSAPSSTVSQDHSITLRLRSLQLMFAILGGQDSSTYASAVLGQGLELLETYEEPGGCRENALISCKRLCDDEGNNDVNRSGGDYAAGGNASCPEPVFMFGYLSPTPSHSEPGVLTCACHGIAFTSRRNVLPKWIFKLPARVARWAPPMEAQQNDIDVDVRLHAMSWLHTSATGIHGDNGMASRALTTLSSLRVSLESRGGYDKLDIAADSVRVRVHHCGERLSHDEFLSELLKVSTANKMRSRGNVGIHGHEFQIIAWEDRVHLAFEGRLEQKEGRAEIRNDRMNVSVSPTGLRALSHVLHESREEEDVDSHSSSPDGRPLVDRGASSPVAARADDAAAPDLTSELQARIEAPDCRNILEDLTSDAFVANENYAKGARLFEDDEDFQLVYVFNNGTDVAPPPAREDPCTQTADSTGSEPSVAAAPAVEACEEEHFGDASGRLFCSNISIRDDYVASTGEGNGVTVASNSLAAIGPLHESYPSPRFTLVVHKIDIVLSMRDEESDSDIELRFDNLQMQLDVFPRASHFAWRCGFVVEDVHVLDHSPNASWRQVAGYFSRRQHPRETASSMAEVVIDAVRPNPEASEDPVELRVRFSALPLRVRLDQKIVHFVMDMCEILYPPQQKPCGDPDEGDCAPAGARAKQNVSASSSTTINVGVSQSTSTFIQSCIVDEWILFVDYIPRRMNVSSLRSGNLAELLNVVSWGGVKLVLSQQSITGITSVGTMFDKIVKVWIDDIVSTQVHKFARGMVAVRSVCSIAEGVGSLITSPLDEMRKENGRFSRGIKKGITTLAKACGEELRQLSATVTKGSSSAGVPQRLSKEEYTAWHRTMLNTGQKDTIVMQVGNVAAAIVGDPETRDVHPPERR